MLGIIYFFSDFRSSQRLEFPKLKELNEESKTAYAINAVYQKQMEMFFDEEY